MTRRPARVTLAPTIAVTLAVIVALTACSGGSSSSSAAASPPSDGSLTVGLLGDIGQPPDPDVYYANNGTAIIINTYEGLVQDANDTDTVKIAPRLATSWDVDATNTTFTFHLRSGVTFHDGTPFTSAAVKASFDRRLAVNGGAAYMVAGVASVATPDPLTAVVTLKAPNAAFLDYLASPFGPKMESPTGLAAHAGTDHDQTYLSTHDLGTGPYELTTAKTGTDYRLTQYKGYWGTKSPFTSVDLPVYNDASALELGLDSGKVSAVVAALPSTAYQKLSTSSSLSSYLLPTLQGALVTLNPSRSFFATTKARTAFLSFLDTKQLVKQGLGARASVATTLYAKGMIPADTSGGGDVQKVTHDTAAFTAYAKTLPAGTALTIGYASGNTNAQTMADLVVANLDALGLKATAQQYETSTVFGWINNPSSGPDAFIDGNNGPDGGNPYMWGHVFWDASGGINYFGCDVPEVDAELNQAVQTDDDVLFVKAAQTYAATGCYLHLSDTKDWVVTQKWLGGVPQAQNLGANELDFSKLTVRKG